MIKLKTHQQNLQQHSILKLIPLLFASLLLSACSENADSEKIDLWPMIKDCDLHTQTCTSKMQERFISLKISPHPVPIARPLGIEVMLKNLNASKIELDISGKNMYMGYNRVLLMPLKETGRYVGTSMLAFCTTAKMQWKLTLIIHQKDGQQIQIPYLLETQNH